MPLLEAGAKINAQTTKGQTALHIALERNITTNAFYLLRKGADIHVRNSDGASCFVYAIQWNRTTVLEEMLRRTASHFIEDQGADYIGYVAQYATISTLHILQQYHYKLQPLRVAKVEHYTTSLLDEFNSRNDIDCQWLDEFDKLREQLQTAQLQPQVSQSSSALQGLMNKVMICSQKPWSTSTWLIPLGFKLPW